MTRTIAENDRSVETSPHGTHALAHPTILVTSGTTRFVVLDNPTSGSADVRPDRRLLFILGARKSAGNRNVPGTESRNRFQTPLGLPRDMSLGSSMPWSTSGSISRRSGPRTVAGATRQASLGRSSSRPAMSWYWRCWPSAAAPCHAPGLRGMMRWLRRNKQARFYYHRSRNIMPRLKNELRR
jgi:hypothetical protein